MKAQIDIKTPSGQSLEGFPHLIYNVTKNFKINKILDTIIEDLVWVKQSPIPWLHPGDTITITILPEERT